MDYDALLNGELDLVEAACELGYFDVDYLEALVETVRIAKVENELLEY